MKKRNLIFLLLAALIFRLVLAFIVWHPDVANHIDWGERFFDYGAKDFYLGSVWDFTWPNQPPGTMYMFAGMYKLYMFVFSIIWWINVKIPLFPSGIVTYFSMEAGSGYQAFVQLPAIAADFGIAYLIYQFLKDNSKKIATTGALIFLFNPAVWYNSSMWGQYDSVISLFGLLSVYLIYKKRLTLALLAFSLSIYIKVSLAIFFPVLIVLALKQQYRPKDYVKSLFVTFLAILMLTVPFADNNPVSWLYYLYEGKILTQQLHVITANAFNLWAALTGIHERPESQMLGPLTYQVWGIILYIGAYVPALLLIIKKQNIKTIFWVLSVVAFSTFMLLTNMHERYLYPLFPVFTIVAVLDKRLLKLYWAVSILSVINLFHFWWQPPIYVIKDAFASYDRLPPRVLSFVNFGLFIYFYRYFWKEVVSKVLYSKAKR